MEKPQPCRQHEGRVIVANETFKHVMAITLDPSSNNRRGVVRCITERSDTIGVKGSTDRSKLYLVRGTSLEQFELSGPLVISGAEELVERLGGSEWDFLGFEDPDIWIDEVHNSTHVYFTIPFVHRDRTTHHSSISLGHAVGKNLDSLVITRPVLEANKVDTTSNKAKEVSIAPLNSNGFRYNLFESRLYQNGISYSTIRIAIAHSMNDPWQFGKTILIPFNTNIAWISGHASPGPLLPSSFIDVGTCKLVGILNGRGANQRKNNQTLYTPFTIGLCIYDYEHGTIDWVSPEPLIRDSEAKNITFASHFVETNPGEGILYAHVDDSFIRAYTLYAKGIRALLPH